MRVCESIRALCCLWGGGQWGITKFVADMVCNISASLLLEVLFIAITAIIIMKSTCKERGATNFFQICQKV